MFGVQVLYYCFTFLNIEFPEIQLLKLKLHKSSFSVECIIIIITGFCAHVFIQQIIDQTFISQLIIAGLQVTTTLA